MQSLPYSLTGFQLKCVALLLMIVDHIYQYIPNMPISLTWIGRIVAPVFFYLMVEGFLHTRNRAKYLLRMWIAAAVMSFGSQLLTTLVPDGSRPITNNIFLSLALSLLLLQAWEWYLHSKQSYQKLLYLFLILVTIAGEIISEANWYGVAMALIFYSMHQDRLLMAATYVSTVLLLTLGMNVLTLGSSALSWHSLFYEQYQWMMVGAIVPILLYNGERGYHAPWVKYAFYVAYPLHIWVLYLISSFIS